MDDRLDFGEDIVLTTSEEEEEESDCEDERSAERRRRFCIERKQSAAVGVGGSQRHPKRPRDDYDRSSFGTNNKRRRNISAVTNEQRQQPPPRTQINPLVVAYQPPIIGASSSSSSSNSSLPNDQKGMEQQQPKGPVIYINPKFVKKFIEKSIKLASLNNNFQPTKPQPPTTTSTTTAATSMIEEIDFKTTPRESLKAASTMAIIRIVTECIEDDDRRDEKLNKALISRLINTLHPEETTKSSSSCSSSSNNYSSAISTAGSEGGQPIPVIGGSVNQFNTCLLGPDGSPYPATTTTRPKRYQDSRRNKLKKQA